MDNLPMYFVIDGDVFVKVYKEGKEIRAVNHTGVSYPSFNAVRNGSVITKEEFEAGNVANSPKSIDV